MNLKIFRFNKKKIKIKIFDSESLKQVHKRIFFATMLFIIIYFSLFVQLINVMIISNYTNNNEFNNTVKEYVSNQRGNIYDRNNELLATNIPSYSLAARPILIKNKKKISNNLATIINYDEDYIYKMLNTSSKFIWIKRDISPQENLKINNIGEIGLEVIKEQKRFYPYGELTSHVVGYTNIDEKGLAGIEKGLDKSLQKNNDIVLSIDLRLQNLINNVLKKTIQKFNASGGASVIIDIDNGQILASSSFPDFNPNNLNLTPKENTFNIITQGVYEMGSTFKPITMAIGYDSKVVNEESMFEVDKPFLVDKYQIDDHKLLEGPLNIKEIIVHSSNRGTAQVAKKIGVSIHKKYLEKFGLFEKMPIEIKEVGKPIIPKPWLPINTITIGYGYGISVSPLHLCSAYAAMVNGGLLKDLTFLKKSKEQFSKRVINEKTSFKIREFLRAVVLETEWTGPRARVLGYEVGGKTGTAEIIKNKQYNKKENLSSFIGVFPISKPKYIVLVMIENPREIEETYNNTTGAWVAAPAVASIIKHMVNILGITPISDKINLKVKYNNFNFREFNSAT